MNKFGLIGDPIDTSSSPALFKAGYGGRYSYDLIEGPDFNISYGKFLDGYSGINVTAPFKLEAFSAADRKSDTCSRIGAANLIVKTGDGTMAFNTDFDGIILSVLEAVLHESGNEIYGRYSEGYGPAAEEVPGIYGRRPSALVAGCGGAGRAAAMAAATLGYDTVLMNRTPEKALEIAEDMPEYGFRTARIYGLFQIIGPGHLHHTGKNTRTGRYRSGFMGAQRQGHPRSQLQESVIHFSTHTGCGDARMHIHSGQKMAALPGPDRIQDIYGRNSRHWKNVRGFVRNID